jgi:dimethylargininase
MPLALVREVASSFADALCAEPPESPIDVAGARAEHAAYVQGLRWLGLTVETLAADDACPDCCFVEDTAVFAGGLAVAARPGATSRRGEVQAVARALAAHVPVVELAAGTLDGGDCLRLGQRLYVGLSARSNAAAITALAALLAPAGVEVVAVPVRAGQLHLKSACSALDDGTVLVAPGVLDAGTLSTLRCIRVPEDEAYAANVVAHRGRVLLPSGFPRTRERLEHAGFATREIDNRELRKADSALTCLSILLP